MVSVTGFTAARMLAIENATIVSGHITGGNLILVAHDGTSYNAGNVVGATGAPGAVGPAGPTSITIVTSTTRPGAPTNGQFIYETDTKRLYVWDGTAWTYRGGIVLCTSTTRPASPFRGLLIYETDTDLMYAYNGTAWIPRGQGIVICTNATRPSAPFAGMKIFETDTGNNYVYSGGIWLYEGPRMPHAKTVRLDSAGFGTSSSTVNVDLPAALSMANFVKYRADSTLLITIEGLIIIDDPSSSVVVAANVGGTVTDVAFVLSGVSTGEAQPFSSTIQITGLAAATIATIKAQWRVSAGTVVATQGGSWAMTVMEIML